MSNSVLLARPHPFIVAEMKPLLEQRGYTTTKLEWLADLPNLVGGAAGAVISLALTSPIEASAEEVFAKLRRTAPHLPVIFAALLDVKPALAKLEEIARSAGVEATVLGVEAGNENSMVLGKPETFLYVPPRRHSLYLLACGPRYAVVSWGRWSSEGQWAWYWKNWIDRRFIARHAVHSTIRRSPTHGEESS